MSPFLFSLAFFASRRLRSRELANERDGDGATNQTGTRGEAGGRDEDEMEMFGSSRDVISSRGVLAAMPVDSNWTSTARTEQAGQGGLGSSQARPWMARTPTVEESDNWLLPRADRRLDDGQAGGIASTRVSL